MDEYAVDEDQVIPEEGKKDDRPKPKGGMMMMGMPMPMGGPKGGMGFKINFEEMMKARSKIKKEPAGASTQRPSSVKSRKMLDKKEDDEEVDNDEEPKKEEQMMNKIYILN